eukprot:scaffold39135_cov66-Phaeocystis_antarctica.AAC.7
MYCSDVYGTVCVSVRHRGTAGAWRLGGGCVGASYTLYLTYENTKFSTLFTILSYDEAEAAAAIAAGPRTY